MIGAVGVVGLEHEQLRADALGDLAVDRAGEHDAALVEHAAEEVVVEGSVSSAGRVCNCMVADRSPDAVVMCNP